MKSLRIFGTIIFLLAFIFGIAAQSDSTSYKSDVPSFKTSENKTIELGAVSPNELESYKFFSEEGRLNKLKPGISTRADVKSIFGEPRQISKNLEFYDYDSNWEIQLAYFDNSFRGPYRRGRPSLILSPEYIGKLYYIKLISKNAVSFNQTVFPAVFIKWSVKMTYINVIGTEVSHEYKDPYGLSYQIFDQSDQKNDLRRPGDLMVIQYAIPDKLIEQMLIEPE